jgi:hypothetical protein
VKTTADLQRRDIEVQFKGHRWIPFQMCELAIMSGTGVVLTDFGFARIDIRTLRVDFGSLTEHRDSFVESYLGGKVRDSVTRFLAPYPFLVTVTEYGDTRVLFTLQQHGGPELKLLEFSEHFETSRLTFDRAFPLYKYAAVNEAPAPQVQVA